MTTDPHLSKKIHKSLSLSWKEGIPASIMLGIVDYYMVPFGLFLGASIQQIGFLVSVPQLLSSIFQLFAAKSVQMTGSRLRFMVSVSIVQALLLIPIAFLSIFNFTGQVIALILLMSAFRISGSLVATAWGSLVSDYLPAHKRGHYFGWRSQIVGIAAVASVAVSGAVLFLMKQYHLALGFLIIFCAAAIVRFISTVLLTKMVDLPVHYSPDADFSFIDFIRRFRESNFVKCILYVAAIIFTTYLSAPYVSVFLLRDLHFDYLSYMGVQFSSVIWSLVAFPIWGKHADVVGNAKILKVTGSLVSIIPILWLLSPIFSYHPIYFITIESFSGFVWGGFNLCITNFIYDAVVPQKRVRCLGYFALINGIAIFLGATTGGWLTQHLPPFLGFTLLTLFAVSSLCRFLAFITLSNSFKEVRTETKKISNLQLFASIFGIKPLAGLNRGWSFFKKGSDPFSDPFFDKPSDEA